MPLTLAEPCVERIPDDEDFADGASCHRRPDTIDLDVTVYEVSASPSSALSGTRSERS